MDHVILVIDYNRGGCVMEYDWDRVMELIVTIFESNIAKIIIGGLIILFIALFLQRIMRSVFKKGRLLSNKESNTLISMTNSIIKYVATIGFIFYILAILGLNIGSMLAGAGVLGIIIGFGAQSLLQDLLAGIFIVYEKQLNQGDFVVINDLHWGTVVEVGFRVLKIRKWAGTILSINNGEVETIENYNNGTMRFIETVTTSFYQDPEETIKALKEACVVLNRKLDDRLVKSPDGQSVEPFHFIGIGKINDNYRGYGYQMIGLVNDDTYWQTARDARSIIAQHLYDRKIKMPEQQVTVRENQHN